MTPGTMRRRGPRRGGHDGFSGQTDGRDGACALAVRAWGRSSPLCLRGTAAVDGGGDAGDRPLGRRFPSQGGAAAENSTCARWIKRIPAPEYELHGRQPPPLNDELIANLGTEEYLQWNVVDRTLPPSDPASTCLLFVTYNTGKPDMVPHNPRESFSPSAGHW